MKRGIIVRDMTSYALPEWIRVSIGTMPQNERFLAELQRLPDLARREPAAV
jgi:histidinol-phosphate aminotransferase